MRNRTRSRNPALHRVLTIAAAATLAFTLAPLHSASAYTEKVLHSFCNWANCGDGDEPFAGLLRDQSGNLYGTTSGGGKYNNGVVFKLIPNPDTGQYKEYILHNFCAHVGCPDGYGPEADIVMDVDGNLYGTTYHGGKYDGGVVFKLTHGENGWALRVIHSFCGTQNCAGGYIPYTVLAYAGQGSGALWDESSPLFGTTYQGGANGKGVAYELVADGSVWNYTVLHAFNAPNDVSAYPGPLLVDSAGNLLGVTRAGAKYGAGALYRLAGGTWKETTLHNFCAWANCVDGRYSVGRLARDAAGNLFGMTFRGGNYGLGAVFERTAGGVYSVIYHFGLQSADGRDPEAGPIMDASGALYGTTSAGGTGDNGTVFQLYYDNGSQQWAENILYSFCSDDEDCKDGEDPEAPLVVDGSGTLYGTTLAGGANTYDGTVFELTP